MARLPIDRVDATLLGGLVGLAAVDRAIHHVAHLVPPATAAQAVRWVEEPLFEFPWNGGAAYITVTDAMGLAASGILLIRFAVWAVAPIRRSGGGQRD